MVFSLSSNLFVITERWPKGDADADLLRLGATESLQTHRGEDLLLHTLCSLVLVCTVYTRRAAQILSPARLTEIRGTSQKKISWWWDDSLLRTNAQ